jgi:hypothetical protein
MDFLQSATDLNGHRLKERRMILKELLADKQAEVKRLQGEIASLREQHARLTDIAKQNRTRRESPETK